MLPEPFRDALVLTGPTGSGKTALGVELAEQLGAEIISMDSMALYRGMDIGTAKPSDQERRRVPHHLIDMLDPWESASVAWWLQQAAACCREIQSRGKRVLFVGGTPLYLKALLYGLFSGPPAHRALRQRLMQEAEALGPQGLHGRLAQADPVTAARLHVNDVRRVIRALEVCQLTGRPMSAWQTQWGVKNQESTVDNQNQCLCLDLPRPELYARIDDRVRHMIGSGFAQEAGQLRRLPRPLSREAAQALGYREMFDCLDGGIGLEETIARIQKRTRHFAKRQISWFRNITECRMCIRQLTFAIWGLTIVHS
jgi:tRNA dimethylallyltransferase